MIAENGAEMTAFGGVTATIQIGSHTTKWKVYVAPIRDSVLIGMDLLNSLDAVIHMGREPSDWKRNNLGHLELSW